MSKKRCLVVMGAMSMGGVQKSLIAFLNYIKKFVDVDLIIWDKASETLPIPDEINVLNIATVKSVRGSLRRDGLISKSFLISCLAIVYKKRWNVMKRLPTQYDIAIAYSNVGFGKYYVIDKVKANKKYAFFHNGEYIAVGSEKKLDHVYYPQYDSIVAVSEYVKSFLTKEFGNSIDITIIANLIDNEDILTKGDEEVQEMSQTQGIKLLTVGRLSEEKNVMIIPDVCAEMKNSGDRFTWFVVGDGPLFTDLEKKIKLLHIEDCCVLCGMQINPYRYMKNCDVYVQLSRYESEGITIKEVSLFDKPMVLSSIPSFIKFAKENKRISLVKENIADIVNIIKTAVISDGFKEAYGYDFNSVSEQAINQMLGGYD